MEPCLSRSIPHGEHSAVWAGDLSVGGELRAPGLRCQQQSPRSVLGGSGLSYGGGGDFLPPTPPLSSAGSEMGLPTAALSVTRGPEHVK